MSLTVALLAISLSLVPTSGLRVNLQMSDPAASTASMIQTQILQALKPCAKCEAPKRYGGLHDGGYAMCSELMQKGKIIAGYSIGLDGYDNWGADVSTQLKVPIYQFDCTNSAHPPCEVNQGTPMEGCDFHFHDLCVAAQPQAMFAKLPPKHVTLEELLAMHGHGKRGDTSDLLLQIDVEGHEWELLAEPGVAETLKEFSQISIELHDILDEHLYSHVPPETKLKALQTLNKHFVLTHVHGNNWSGNDSRNDPSNPMKSYSVPQALEALYVRRGQVTEHECLTDPAVWAEDEPNAANRADIDIPHLPKL